MLPKARTERTESQEVRQVFDKQKSQDVLWDQETTVAQLCNHILPGGNIVTNVVRLATDTHKFQEQVSSIQTTIGTKVQPKDLIDIMSHPVSTSSGRSI